jgi:hypothetical protein
MAEVRLFTHHECAHISRFVCNVRWFHGLRIRPLLIGDPVRIQKARKNGGFYREIHVLRQVAVLDGHFQGSKFRADDADEIATLIKYLCFALSR